MSRAGEDTAREAPDAQQGTPCEMCGQVTLILSDHSGSWNECVDCGQIQNVHRTPGGQPGRLTP